MKSSGNAIIMVMKYWRETDRQEVECRVRKILDPALNKCLTVKINQEQWDMLVTMMYGVSQTYTINKKNELIRSLNAGEKMIPNNLPLNIDKKGDKWVQNWLK